MGHDENQPLGPGDDPPGRNRFLLAVLAALPIAALGGIAVGKEGTLAGSELALTVVAATVAFVILYALIVVVRAAAQRKVVGVGLFGGRLDPPKEDDATNLAQHEALASQAKATEQVAKATTEQLAHDKELLKAEKDRADREAERADREAARADALQRRLDAARFIRDPRASDSRDEQDVRVRPANPTPDQRPPG